MSFLKKLFKKKKEEEKPPQTAAKAITKYTLKRLAKTDKGHGWISIADYEGPITPDDLKAIIESEPELYPYGKYRLDKYYEDGTFDVVWKGDFFETIEEGKEREVLKPTPKTVRGLELDEFIYIAKKLAERKEELQQALTTLSTMFSPQIDIEKAIDEYFEKGEKIARRLGYVPAATVGEKENIPVEGKIPAALVYAPKAIEDTLEAVEKRLVRWGVISQPAPQIPDTGERKFIKLPTKPEGETVDSGET